MNGDNSGFEAWLQGHSITDVQGSKLPTYHKQDMREAYHAGLRDAIERAIQACRGVMAVYDQQNGPGPSIEGSVCSDCIGAIRGLGADTRKRCTCDGAGRGPGRACVVKAGGRLGELWRCAEGLEPERAAFEAWLNPGRHAGNVSRWVPPGRYENEAHSLAWLAWRDGRAAERERCQPDGLKFDALGAPRARYVRVTLNGSHCVMDAREGDRYVQEAREAGDDSEYTVSDVWLSEREFDDLPEFEGF